MTQKQQEQLEKFIKFTSWMYKDCARAELFAGSQFLSALGLFNYIEIVGAFLKGYFKKDIKSGRILKFEKGKRKGNNVPTTSLERFNAFFI